MFYLKHFVNVLVNPLGIGLALLVLGFVSVCVRHRFACARCRRHAKWGGVACFAFGFGWLWLWSTLAWTTVIGTGLEDDWPVQRAEDLPSADAIVVLGGGMGSSPDFYPYPDMWMAADRVWHAARLYRAGKAPLVLASGGSDRTSTLPLLRDFGVPESALRCEDNSRNTEENARFTAQLLGKGGRILLVTSAFHMTRARMMFERYAPELAVIPAPTDYEAFVLTHQRRKIDDFLPDADSLMRNSIYFKECLGQLAYRLIKR